MSEANRVPSARDIMATSLITFRPEMSIFQAIRILLQKQISGAPVVNEGGAMVGILSELDCLRVLSSDEFYAGQQEEAGTVGDFMSSPGQTIPPELGIYAIAHYFVTTSVRRLPVIEDDKLVGQVSRRDVLSGIEKMADKRSRPRRYPDYREPSSAAMARGPR
jgi:CBS domain-containing protein